MTDKTQDRLEEIKHLNEYGGIDDGMRYRYIDELLDMIEQQQAALRLAAEALEELVEVSVCSCARGDQFDIIHHKQCDWLKVQAALAAIQKLKEK